MAEEKKNLLRIHTQTGRSTTSRGGRSSPDELDSVVHLASVEKVLDFCRANSLWPLTFGLSCCAIEMMVAGMARFDLALRGRSICPSPRHCDLMIVAGTVNKKWRPAC